MSWDLITVDKIGTASLDALFDNSIGAIRVPEFLPGECLKAAVEGICRRGLDYYQDVHPPIGRIGITQFEHRHGSSARRDYFTQAVAAEADRLETFRTSGDLVQQVIDALVAAWPGEVQVAVEPDGSRYFAGLVRVIGEALLHCDWAPFDAPAPDWTIGTIDAQITWNIYCQMPSSGGATYVYRRPWTPDTQAHQLPGSYGYDEIVVDGSERLRIRPAEGDLILFNSRNFHRIEQGSGAERVSVSSFVGRQPDSSLVLWS